MLTHAIGVQASAAARDQQLRWLQCHEAACPTVTQLMRSRLTSHMLALQRMDCSLAYCPKQQAELLTAAFAAISTAPTTLPDAQDEVLSALLQDTACPAVLGAAASESAGYAVVTVGEVRLALRSLPSHRAPGEDGLPLEFWRLADGAWAPVLALIYSAMFQLQRTPCRFTLGRITPLHKGGPMCQASNYRPITLLNNDYKVLARVPAERFGKAMPACIGLEQTAYLPGREIGDASSTRNWLL
jgi:hypothetical protein